MNLEDFFTPTNSSISSLNLQRRFLYMQRRFIEEGNTAALRQLQRIYDNLINSVRLTRNTVSIPSSVFRPPSGRDVGGLMTRRDNVVSDLMNPSNSLMTRVYRERERFGRVISGEGITGFNVRRQAPLNSLNETLRARERHYDFLRSLETPDTEIFRTGTPSFASDENWMYQTGLAESRSSGEGDFSYLREQEDEQNRRREKLRNVQRQSNLDALKRRRKEQEQREEDAYQARRFRRRERREAYERFPWLKPLVHSNPIIANNLPSIAKSLKKWSKMPFVGGFIKHPLAITAGIGLGLASTIIKESDKANKTTTDWKNAANFFGTAPKEFENVARLAGYKDEGEIAKLYGHMTMRFGDPMMALRSLGPDMMNSHPLARMMFASDHGLDEKSMTMFDIAAGKPGLNNKARLVNKELHNLENLQTKGFSSDASWLEQIVSLYLSIPFNKSRLARKIVRARRYVTKDNELPPKFDSLESAVNSQDAYQREYGTGASNGTGGEKNINVNVTTGDVVLPNAQNGNDVIKGIINYSADKSDCEAVLHMFDSKTE